jgi:hypothetical protein
MASNHDQDRAQWKRWRDQVHAEIERLDEVEDRLASPPDHEASREHLASHASHLNQTAHTLAAMAREMEEYRREHFSGDE